MFDIGGPELLLILGIALLVFGPRRIPELGRRLGTAVTHLRRAGREMRNTLEREVAIEDVRREAAGLRESGEKVRRELGGLYEEAAGKTPAAPDRGEDDPPEPRPSSDADRGPSGAAGPGEGLSG
jgi:Tat protein translocase TatB subunit